jgi:hypothetical protein
VRTNSQSNNNFFGWLMMTTNRAQLDNASPKTFLKANLKGESNSKARSAGLNGQWLIASATLEKGLLPNSVEEHVLLIELSGE